MQAGDVLAKIPRETTKTKDITGGLPRVVELFETRKPKDPAVISEIDGIVKYGDIAKGMRKIHVEAEDGKTTKEYSIPRGIHINVQEGDHVRGRRGFDRRSAQPARLAGGTRRKVHAGLPGERHSRGLPPAGREHQRQAHRNHLPADDALGEGGRRGRHDVPAGRAGGQVPLPRRKRSHYRRRWTSGNGPPAAPGYHQGFAVHRFVHLGGELPGNHARAHRSRRGRQGGLPARAEGKRHHGPAHSCRHRVWSITAAFSC